VCGIHQNVKPQGEKISVSAICMSCHEYDEKQLSLHTRHKALASAGCTDCHQQKDPDVNEYKESNVHSYGYFLIHPLGCWDEKIYNQCGKCHADKPEKWAYNTVMGWKKAVVIDH